MIVKHIYASKRWPEYRTGCRSRADCYRLIAYNQRTSAKGVSIWNDFAGTSPNEIADECEYLHQGQKIWLYPIVISFPVGETDLWEGREKEIIAELQSTLRVSKGVWDAHRDKKHYHLHGALLAFGSNGRQLRLGSVNEDGQPIQISTTLRKFAQSWEDRVGGATKTGRGEQNLNLSRESIAAADRQFTVGQKPSPVPTKMQLKADVERIVLFSSSFAALEANAEREGITMLYKHADDGTVLGISFSKDGVSIRGRDANASYPRLLSIYEHKPTQTSLHNCRVAGRALQQNRGQTIPGTDARDYQANGVVGKDPRSGGRPFQGFERRYRQFETTFPAVRQRDPFVSILQTLLVGFHRIMNQNDFREPFFKPKPPHER